MVALRDLVELVRAPAALSVPGDLLAGAAATGWPHGRRTPGMIAASVCLYWAGMALNDYADRELDATERPERPIPSGRITPSQALTVATTLTATGIALAAMSGRTRGLATALPLAATIWAYDTTLKPTPAGPAAMSLARALNVLMGGPSGTTAALIAAHTYTVTTLSRHEVHGTTQAIPAATLAGTTAVAATSLLRRGARNRAVAAAAITHYLTAYGRAQSAALRKPTAEHIRTAVGAGITGLLPLQAALTATAGSLAAAVSLTLGHPLAKALARKVSPT